MNILKYLIGIIILIILIFLKPVIFIRFGYFQSARIGGLIPQFQNYLNENLDQKFNNIDILCFESSICNSFLSESLKNRIKISSNYKLILSIINCLKKTNFKFVNLFIIKMNSMPYDSFLISKKKKFFNGN